MALLPLSKRRADDEPAGLSRVFAPCDVCGRAALARCARATRTPLSCSFISGGASLTSHTMMFCFRLAVQLTTVSRTWAPPLRTRSWLLWPTSLLRSQAGRRRFRFEFASAGSCWTFMQTVGVASA